MTLDGGMDGFSHCIEVYLGAKGDGVNRIEKIALAGIELIVTGLAVLGRDACGQVAKWDVYRTSPPNSPVLVVTATVSVAGSQ